MLSFLLPLLLSTAQAIYPSTDLADTEWGVLSNGKGKAWVGCSSKTEITWCRSIGVINASQDKLSKILLDFESYPQVFKRVYKTKILEPDVVHLLLDMPFPFKQRDYIAKFVETREGKDVLFTFNAVEHSEAAAPSRESVRLPRAAGRWRLEPMSPKQTRVTYTWNGELLGKIPLFGLAEAWRTQGTEVMEWLEAAAATK